MTFLLERRIWAIAVFFPLFAAASPIVSRKPPKADTASLLAQGKRDEAKGDFRRALSDYAAVLRSDPGNAEAYLEIGLIQGQNLNITGAAESFQAALRKDPSSAEAHYNLGLTMVADPGNNPQWAGAMNEFTTALKIRPHYPEALNMLGVGLLETGEPATAVPEFRSALLLQPNSAEIHFNLARSLEAIGKNSEAYTEYLAALRLRSNYPEAENLLGNMLRRSKSYVAAIRYFKEALTADPDLETAHYGLAESLKAQGDSRGAQVEFKEASALIQRNLDALRSSHLSNESLDLAKKGDFPAAIHSAQQALKLEPDNALAHYNLGLLFADSGNFPSAIHELRNAISLMPLRASFYVNMSRMQMKAGYRQRAIDSLRRAVDLESSSPVLKEEMKSLQDSVPSAAQRSSSAKIPLVPFPYGAATNTATDHFAFATQLSKEGDLNGAIGELLRALNLVPNQVDIRYNLAVAYTQAGEFENAEMELQKVLLLRPASIQANLALGVLLLQRNDRIDAAKAFRTVLAQQPDNREAALLLSQEQGSIAK